MYQYLNRASSSKPAKSKVRVNRSADYLQTMVCKRQKQTATFRGEKDSCENMVTPTYTLRDHTVVYSFQARALVNVSNMNAYGVGRLNQDHRDIHPLAQVSHDGSFPLCEWFLVEEWKEKKQEKLRCCKLYKKVIYRYVQLE